MHRDLKPGNIMINRQGQAKVLDFGLAKLLHADSAVNELAATETAGQTGVATDEGVIVGSAPYMSPEQAEGLAVDTRSDIFSFGSVLYEMVTGQRAFKGDSKLSTLAAIVQQEPRTVSELRAVPPELERIINRCLRKDINRRSQHIADIKLALEELSDDAGSGKLVSVVPVQFGARRWLWPAITFFTLVIAAAAVWDRLHREREVTHSELVRLTPEDDYAYYRPAISEDGKFVAFISDRGGKPDVWLQRVGSGDPIQLTHSALGAHRPSFSPDGTQIVYDTGNAVSLGDIYTIPLLGGEPQKLAESGWDPRFSPDGRSIAFRSVPGAKVVSANGGQPRLLLGSSGSPFVDAWGNPFPGLVWIDSEHLLTALPVSAANSQGDWDWFVLPTEGGKRIATGLSQRFRATGFTTAVPGFSRGDGVVFAANKNGQQNLWRIEIEKGSWSTGSLQQLTFGTELMEAQSASLDGVAAVEISHPASDAYFVPMDIAAGSVTGAALRPTKEPRLKTSISIETSDAYCFRTQNGWVLKHFDSGKEMRLVSSSSPAFSPDGRQAVLTRIDGDTFTMSIHQLDPSANEADRVLCSKCGIPTAFSPDPRYLLYYDSPSRKPDDPFRKSSIYLLDVATGKIRIWLDHPKYILIGLGPVGKRPRGLVVIAQEPGTRQSRWYFLPWTERALSESDWIEIPKDGRASTGSNLYYFFKGNDLMALRLDQRGSEPFAIKQMPGSQPIFGYEDQGNWDIGPRGLVFLRREIRSSVWLAKLPDR